MAALGAAGVPGAAAAAASKPKEETAAPPAASGGAAAAAASGGGASDGTVLTPKVRGGAGLAGTKRRREEDSTATAPPALASFILTLPAVEERLGAFLAPDEIGKLRMAFRNGTTSDLYRGIGRAYSAGFARRTGDTTGTWDLVSASDGRLTVNIYSIGAGAVPPWMLSADWRRITSGIDTTHHWVLRHYDNEGDNRKTYLSTLMFRNN